MKKTTPLAQRRMRIRPIISAQDQRVGQLWEEGMGSGQEQTSVLRFEGKWSIPGKASHNSPIAHLPFFFVNQEMSNMFPFRKCAVPYTPAYISPIIMAFVHRLCNVLCQLFRG